MPRSPRNPTPERHAPPGSPVRAATASLLDDCPRVRGRCPCLKRPQRPKLPPPLPRLTFSDHQSDSHLHQARGCRRDAPGRYEPGAQDASSDRGLRDRGRAQRSDRPRTGPDGERAPGRLRRLAQADPERPVRRRGRYRGPRRVGGQARTTAGRPSADSVAGGTLRRGQRHVARAEVIRPSGGTRAAALLHVCRTVCRRAERLAVAGGDELNPEVVRYLNRLSDLLFILSRGANRGQEPLWEPGRYGAGGPEPGD